MKHYDHHHDTVAEARACEAERGGVATEAKPEYVARLERSHKVGPLTYGKVGREPAFATQPAHQKRVAYAHDLLRKRVSDSLSIDLVEVAMHLMEGKQVSATEIGNLIDALRACPRKGAQDPAPTRPVRQEADEPATEEAKPGKVAWAEWRKLAAELVQVGGSTGARFAVATEAGSDNDLAFWWITKFESYGGTRYYLRQVIGGQGAVRVSMGPEAMVAVARKIKEAGAYEAMIRFGQEIGACGHCGRTLTNQESREAGIGPVCRNK